MSEARRGCGYRKIGGLYLVSNPGNPGSYINCDGLPLPLIDCECCGFTPAFSRSFQWITKSYIQHISRKRHGEKEWNPKEMCSCPPVCPICHSENVDQEKFGLMWVGQKFYTPESFTKEAMTMGISKRIPEIPQGLVFGQTWVFAAHLKVPDHKVEPNGGLLNKEPKTEAAIFHGFKPDRVEMPLWKGSVSDEMLLKLEKRGITPVLLDPTPENKKLHKEAENKKGLLDWIFKTTSLDDEKEPLEDRAWHKQQEDLADHRRLHEPDYDEPNPEVEGD